MSTTIAGTAATYPPTYRLSRRGRAVVFLLGFLVLLAIGIVFAGGSVATGEKETTTTIVVAPGQTLWDVASDVSEGGDVRDAMTHLVELNDLDSVVLDAGQRLEVPTG